MKIKMLLVLLIASTAVAADVKFYEYPTAGSLPDAGRLPLYDPAAGSRNVTGAQIKDAAKEVYLTEGQSLNVYRPGGAKLYSVTPSSEERLTVYAGDGTRKLFSVMSSAGIVIH